MGRDPRSSQRETWVSLIVAGRELTEATFPGRADSTAIARDIEHMNTCDKIGARRGRCDPLVAVNVNTPEDYAALATLVTASLK